LVLHGTRKSPNIRRENEIALSNVPLRTTVCQKDDSVPQIVTLWRRKSSAGLEKAIAGIAL
jgi:hypothetical protein